MRQFSHFLLRQPHLPTLKLAKLAEATATLRTSRHAIQAATTRAQHTLTARTTVLATHLARTIIQQQAATTTQQLLATTNITTVIQILAVTAVTMAEAQGTILATVDTIAATIVAITQAILATTAMVA